MTLQVSRTPAILAAASAAAPGTCGELVQGFLDGRHFHVTCPIDLFSKATVQVVAGSGRVFGPEECPKTVRAVELTLQALGRSDVDAYVALRSRLPRGNGMASSTADVSAAIAAAAEALDASLPAERIAELAIAVEPSDGVMFPGIALFDHRAGAIADRLGNPPPMRVLVLDFGGAVDTVAFNTADRASVLASLEGTWREALAMVRHGIGAGDPRPIAEGATLSAKGHHGLWPRPELPGVLALAKETGALGVDLAHSGTVLGLLFPDDPEQVAYAGVKAQQRLPGLRDAFPARIVSGGIRSTALHQ